MELYTKVLRRIDQLEQEYIRFWIEICKLESPSDYKPGVDAVGRYFTEKALDRGWKVDVLDQPVSGNGVCITMNPDRTGQPIVLSGHMDTVHPVGSFGKQIVTMDEEKIYGPGVTDCKGGLAAAFCAMVALDDCGFCSRPVKLILQSDEEVSSMTSNKETVRFMAEKSEGCIGFLNCEPHSSGVSVLTRKGISRYDFEITGIASHAGYCYGGANAIREAAYKILELEKLKDQNGITCNCGLISGGTATNTVAGKCSFSLDVRFADEAQMQIADAIIRQIAEKTFVEGTSCTWKLVSTRCAMERVERNVALLQKVNRALEQAGLPIVKESRSNGGSDAADMTSFGVPCIDSFGIEGGGIHSLAEWAWLASLKRTASRLAAVVCFIE